MKNVSQKERNENRMLNKLLKERNPHLEKNKNTNTDTH